MSIIEMSVTGGIMILAVIVMHALGVNKLPKMALILMWEIVLLRLLLPISIPLPILPAVQAPSISAPSVQDVDYTAPDLFMPIYDMSNYTPSQTAPAMPQQSQTVTKPPVQIQPAEQASASAPQFHISLDAVYAAGATAIALFFVLSYVHNIKKFRTSLPVENDYVSDWLNAHKGGRKISVRYSDRIVSPLTYGILRPVILLPKDTDLSDQNLLAYILEHEYAHIRHFDSVKKLIAALALCLHWFNPIVWAMYILYNRDMELWCDECVIKRFGEKSRSAYARMLITMEEIKCSAPLMSYFRKNSIEERIISIMKFKKSTLISIVVAVLLIAAITVTIIATSINPVPKEPDFTDEPPVSDGINDEQGEVSNVSEEDQVDIVPAAIDNTDVHVGKSGDEEASNSINWSVFYGQPSTGDLSGMKNYFDYTKERWEIKDEVPIIEDPELYAAAIDIVVETDVFDNMLYPSISAVSGDEHGIVAVIDIDIKDLALPEDIPEDAILQFRGASDNFYYDAGEWYPLEFLSHNGTVYTYVYSCFAVDRGLPDEVVFELRDFGYDNGEMFVTLVKGTYRLKIDADSFNTTEKLKKISEPIEVKGAELELELTPFGLVVKESYSETDIDRNWPWQDKYFLMQGDCFDFCLRDGSVIGEEEDYFDTAFYGLTRSIHGWVDFENHICYYHYGYMVPIDVEEIEAVTVHGVRFDLDYAE